MMRMPTAAIAAAELRFERSRHDVSERLHRAGVACRANLARPATLALVAGAGFFIGLRLMRRPAAAAVPAPAPLPAGKFAVVLAFLIRYGMEKFAHRQVRRYAV
jgi:hypothetical protein